MYLRHSSVLLERVFLSMLPLLNCPKSGKRIFKSVSVVVQYFSVLHRKLPPGFRALNKLTGEQETNVGAKKRVSEGYARADSLDKPKLKKYVKGIAKEAKLYRNARERT